MDTDESRGAAVRFRLLQLADSQLPIGAFAHSGGWETYGQLGYSAESLREWLEAHFDQGSGRLDLALAAAAWRYGGDPRELAALAEEASAWRSVPGAHKASMQLGRRLLVLARRLWPDEAEACAVDPAHYSVVFGALGRALGLPLRGSLETLAHSSAVTLLAAATRAMALSPERSQQILVQLQPRLAAAVDDVLDEGLDACFSATPAADIRAHQQALLHTRLFQS